VWVTYLYKHLTFNVVCLSDFMFCKVRLGIGFPHQKHKIVSLLFHIPSITTLATQRTYISLRQINDKLKVISHNSTKSFTDSTATILFIATRLRTDRPGGSNPDRGQIIFSKLSILALRSTNPYIL